MHFLDHVDDRLGARHALTGTGEVGPVDEKRVLVHGRSEDGHGVDGAARRRRRRHARRASNQIEHAEPARWHRADVVGSEASLESAAPRIDARVRFHVDRLSDACHLQHDGDVARLTRADGQTLDAVDGEGRPIDDQRVLAWGQDMEAPLPLVVRGRSLLAAHQRLRRDAHVGAGEDATLLVLDRAGERPGQPLGDCLARWEREEEKRREQRDG